MTPVSGPGDRRLVRLLLPPVGGNGLLRDTVWNAVSNAGMAALGFFVLMLAARLGDAYWCGVAALGLAMSQQLYTLGNFTMQSYQASDVAERRSFGDYVAAKAVSLSAMAAAAAVWIAVASPGPDKTAAFLALLVYQASEAFSNAFFARYQQKGRLDTACRVRFAKTAAFVLVYAGVFAATRRLLPALAAAAAAHAGLFFVLDRPLLRHFGPLRPHAPDRAAFSVLAACAPIAFNSFLLMYVNNGPKFAVDRVLGTEKLAVFSALFVVFFAVSVCSDFLMNPQVVPLADAVRRGDRAGAVRILARPLAAVLALAAAGCAAAAAAGIPFLGWLFGLDLAGNRRILCLLVGGGGLLALYQLSLVVLIVLRKQFWGMAGMGAAAAFVFFAAGPLVRDRGLAGAAWCSLLAVSVLFAVSAGFALFFFLRANWTGRPVYGSIPGNSPDTPTDA
ncbi:MAG: hypothetical protein IJV65_09375 [Kiritimatiellae bacterium]|nr:hypothetical protein [Kiritimatiellia bacterium]